MSDLSSVIQTTIGQHFFGVPNATDGEELAGKVELVVREWIEETLEETREQRMDIVYDGAIWSTGIMKRADRVLLDAIGEQGEQNEP